MKRAAPALLPVLALLLPLAGAAAQEPPPVPIQAEPLPALQMPAAGQPPAPQQPPATAGQVAAPGQAAPPPQGTAAAQTPAPGQAAPGQAAPGQAAPGQAAPGQAVAPGQDATAGQDAAAPPPPPPWLPRTTATLILLDKIAAQPQTVTVKVGGQVMFGSLTIAVGACEARPPDLEADATALLTITDRNPGMPGFSGWMLANEPGVSMLQHPMYDVRLAGCAG